MKKVQSDVDRKVDDFTKAVTEIVKTANEQFKEQSLSYIHQNYQGLTPEAKANLEQIWAANYPVVKEADVQVIMQKFKNELYSEEHDKMHEVLGKMSSFLYDSLATSLQAVMRDHLKKGLFDPCLLPLFFSSLKLIFSLFLSIT